LSQAAAVETHVSEPVEYSLTDSLGKLGMWTFLAGDAMGFGALIVGYGALRIYSANWPQPSNVLGIPLTAFMTFVLICSSVTMVKGLSAIQHGDQAGLRLFLLLTILGGSIFLGLQAYEWTHLISSPPHGKGVGISGNPYGAAQFGTTFFARDRRRDLSPHPAHPVAFWQVFGGALPSHRDRGTLLALRRSRLDFDFYLRLFALGGGSRPCGRVEQDCRVRPPEHRATPYALTGIRG
jgi:heme/copper-type cytochrome/quinol oxidase subunit 3